MDKSETYIKMSDCEEVREIWANYDYVFDDDLGIFIEKQFRKHRWAFCDVPDKDYYIFLPRQETIQEAFGLKSINNSWCLLEEWWVGFHEFYSRYWQSERSQGRNITSYGEQFTSMEQLSLAYYLWEKHRFDVTSHFS